MLSALFDRLFKRTPSPERFARLFIAAARKAGYRGELEFEPDEFRVSHDSGSFFNLHKCLPCLQQGGPSGARQRPARLCQHADECRSDK